MNNKNMVENRPLTKEELANAAALWDVFAGQEKPFHIEGNPHTGLFAYWLPEQDSKEKALLEEKVALEARLQEIETELRIRKQ